MLGYPFLRGLLACHQLCHPFLRFSPEHTKANVWALKRRPSRFIDGSGQTEQRHVPVSAGTRAHLPRPISAVLGLPDWFKAMPQKVFSQTMQDDVFTIKKCPPVIDAMTCGFLMPLACDLRIENGEFSVGRRTAWDHNYRSPIDFHVDSQVAGTPFFDTDRFIIKFNNFWTVEASAELFAAGDPPDQP